MDILIYPQIFSSLARFKTMSCNDGRFMFACLVNQLLRCISLFDIFILFKKNEWICNDIILIINYYITFFLNKM